MYFVLREIEERDALDDEKREEVGEQDQIFDFDMIDFACDSVPHGGLVCNSNTSNQRGEIEARQGSNFRLIQNHKNALDFLSTKYVRRH